MHHPGNVAFTQKQEAEVGCHGDFVGPAEVNLRRPADLGAGGIAFRIGSDRLLKGTAVILTWFLRPCVLRPIVMVVDPLNGKVTHLAITLQNHDRVGTAGDQCDPNGTRSEN